MRALTQLGFVPRDAHGTNALADSLKRASLNLPESYVQFLGHAPPIGRMFGFKFRRGRNGQEWEGQVERFFDYGSQPNLLESSVLKPDDRVLLPIATDAGGMSSISTCAHWASRSLTTITRPGNSPRSPQVLRPSSTAFMRSISDDRIDLSAKEDLP